jgi:hypothetical protein
MRTRGLVWGTALAQVFQVLDKLEGFENCYYTKAKKMQINIIT